MNTNRRIANPRGQAVVPTDNMVAPKELVFFFLKDPKSKIRFPEVTM